jgi:lipopolysaccharide/colanic/teichoic acid biosynthesis glycosyltransferase
VGVARIGRIGDDGRAGQSADRVLDAVLAASPWEAELYTEDHRGRSNVLPGITGLCQVSGRSRLTMREALDLDVEYVRRRSLLMDLLILVRTDGCLLRREAV